MGAQPSHEANGSASVQGSRDTPGGLVGSLQDVIPITGPGDCVKELTYSFTWAGLACMHSHQESEASMRKNTCFAIGAMVIGLAIIFWARSAVPSSADVRPKAAGPLYFVKSSPYLPFRVAEPAW